MVFRFKKNATSQANEKESIGKLEDNPYLQSRALWFDIYGSAEERYRKSRRLNVCLSALVGLSILGIIYIGAQSKYIPYVVEMQKGQIISTGSVSHTNFNSIKPQLVHYFIQQFVTSARSVSVDGYLEREHQKRAFALTKDAATSELIEYFNQHDPYTIIKSRMINVEVNYINQLPHDAIEVGWTETDRDSQSGQTISHQQFVGEFDFKWDMPSQNEFILQNNPFGFYITNISWTGVK